MEQPMFMKRTTQLLNEMLDREAPKASGTLLEENVGLTALPSTITTESGQMLFSIALNLLVRTFSRVTLLPPLGTEQLSLAYQVFEQLWGFPWPAAGGGQVAAGSESDVVLAVGGTEVTPPPLGTVSLGCDGWIAKYQRGVGPLPVQMNGNPVGAAVAACLGVAQVFGAVVRPSLATKYHMRFSGPDQLSWSAYSYRDDETNPALAATIHLDHVVLVGMGGVGSTLGAVLAWTRGLAGDLILIDPDRVDETNLNRYLTAPRTSVGQAKTEVARQHLLRHHPELRLLSAPMPYQQFIRQAGRPVGTLVCSVDSEPLRAFIQSDLPKVIIDAATSGPVLGVSRHNFLDGACLGCLHPRPDNPYEQELQMAKVLGLTLGEIIDRLNSEAPLSPPELTVLAGRLGLGEGLQFSAGKPLRAFWAENVCGRVSMPTVDQPEATGSAAFVSALGGALAAGELIKDATQQTALDNQFMMQVFRGPTRAYPRKRLKDPKCSAFCAEDAMRLAYSELHRPGNAEGTK